MQNSKPVKINFGAAGFKKEGFVNVDWQAIVKPDVEHNLNVFPYPFETGSAELIEAFHVIEHLDRPFDVMKEFHRILAPGGKMIIKVPHFSRTMTHPEHFHGFDVTFPNYFNKRYVSVGYFGTELTLESMTISWLAFFHILREMGYSETMITVLRGANVFISFLANLSPNFASRIWCFWVGGFDEIEFVFTKPKA